MEWIGSIILGVVQGLTEFLPVSSSGHLVITQKLLGYEKHNILLDVAVHFGTLLSVLTVYRDEIYTLFRDSLSKSHWSSNSSGSSLYINVLVATLPTAVIGLTFKDFFEGLFSSLLAVAICLFFTGMVLYSTRLVSRSATELELNPHLRFSFYTAFAIGLAQSFAISPGISRSGMTIAAGIMLGLRPGQAAYFSFLLAIPAILGGVLLTAKDAIWTQELVFQVGVAMLSSYIFGWIGLLAVLRVVNGGRLEYFSYYLWALSMTIFVLHFW